MERLTEYSGKTPTVRGCGKNCKHEYRYCNNMEDCPTLDDVIAKLAKYEDMEEHGILKILPCKVGDTVYTVLRNKYVQQLIVCEISLFKSSDVGLCIQLKCSKDGTNGYMHYLSTSIGKNLFMSEKKAQQALKECELK